MPLFQDTQLQSDPKPQLKTCPTKGSAMSLPVGHVLWVLKIGSSICLENPKLKRGCLTRLSSGICYYCFGLWAPTLLPLSPKSIYFFLGSLNSLVEEADLSGSMLVFRRVTPCLVCVRGT